MPAPPHSGGVVGDRGRADAERRNFQNANVYGSGRVPLPDMMRAGLLVNILAWGVIIAVSAATVRWFG